MNWTSNSPGDYHRIIDIQITSTISGGNPWAGAIMVMQACLPRYAFTGAGRVVPWDQTGAPRKLCRRGANLTGFLARAFE